MAEKKIKVLIVDDSLFIREFLSRELSKDAGIEIVGKAGDAYEARDLIIKYEPDVMTLDLEMPKMFGLDFLRKLLPQYPLPVIVVSSVSQAVFEAMEAGAVDFVDKARMRDGSARESFVSELIVKVKVASVARVGKQTRKRTVHARPVRNNITGHDRRMIAIGASTGGTEALYSILNKVGNDLPPIVVVQHMPPTFTAMFAQRLNTNCEPEVKEAKQGDILQPGHVYIAEGGLQMQVTKKQNSYMIHCFEGEKVSGHCPSVDVMFQSVAACAGANALGVILTGMGSDGAKGLLAMRENGAHTIGQNKETCVVYGMPKVAYDIGAVEDEISLEDIAQGIYTWNDNSRK